MDFFRSLHGYLIDGVVLISIAHISCVLAQLCKLIIFSKLLMNSLGYVDLCGK